MAQKLHIGKKLVGKVSERERDEIKALFERKNGLTELFKIVSADNLQLYEKLVTDMGATTTKFQQWWDKKSKEHKWEDVKGCNWEIDFITCEIFLVRQ